MWQNLSLIFRKLSHDPNVRAVILTGAGDRAFTAGLDIKVSLLSHRIPPLLTQRPGRLNRIHVQPEQRPSPRRQRKQALHPRLPRVHNLR